MHKYGVYIKAILYILLFNGKKLAGSPGDGPGLLRNTAGASSGRSFPNIAASNVAKASIANPNIARNFRNRNRPIEASPFPNSNLLSHLKQPSKHEKPSRSTTGIRYKEPSFYNSSTGKFSSKFQDTVLVSLDINKTTDPFGYEVFDKGNKLIFKAKQHFVFGIVKSGATVLWQSNQRDYPNKVIYKVVNGENRVKVYFPNPEPIVSRLQVVRPTRPKPEMSESAVSAGARNVSAATVTSTDTLPTTTTLKPIPTSDTAVKPAKSDLSAPIPTTYDPYWYYRRVETLVPPLTNPKKPDPPQPLKSEAPEPELQSDTESEFELEYDPDQPPFWQVEYITLDVQSKASSRKFHFFEDIKTNTGIYFVKQGYLFSRIKFSQPFYVCLLDLYSVWKVSGQCPYAKMVMVNGLDEAEPHITIYFTDGSHRFNFIEYIYKWTEKPKPFESAVELPRSDLPNVRIYTSTDSGVSMNDLSQFTPTMYTVSNAQKIKFPNLLSYHFKFNHSNCIKIVVKDSLVWSHSDDAPFPTSMYFFASFDLVVIEFAYYLFHIYKYHGDEWFFFHLD